MASTSASGTDTQQLLTRLQSGELAGSWKLDPARSSVALRSKTMWGLVSVKGTFSEVSGQAQVSPTGDITGTVTIGAASVNTKVKKRDQHLQSADFFDVANHPSIVYSVRSVGPSEGGPTADGELTIRGVSRPVSVPLAARADGDAIRLDAEITVDRSQWGMDWNQLGMTKMQNVITVAAVFTRA